MGVAGWLANNWFPLLQTAGIISGLIFTGVSLQIDSKVRRIQNLLTLTEHHRDIWVKLYERPELLELLKTEHKPTNTPPTFEQELFVNLIVLHLNAVYQAMKRGMFIPPEGLQKDIRFFF